MAFSDLSVDAQTYLLSQYSYTAKWLVFFLIITLSSYYIFYVWKTHTQTKYITVAMFRMLLFALSFVSLITSPLLLLSMSPEYDFYSFYQLPLTIYSIIAAIFFVVFFVDMMRYGFFVLLKLAGLDVKDPHANEIARQIENNKHFIKLKFKG